MTTAPDSSMQPPHDVHNPQDEPQREADATAASVTDGLPGTWSAVANADDDALAAFERLTLSELLGQLVRQPGKTARLLFAVSQQTVGSASAVPADRPAAEHAPTLAPDYDVSAALGAAGAEDGVLDDDERAANLTQRQRESGIIGMRLSAFLIAWQGSGLLANTPHRTEETALIAGLPYLAVGMGLWILSEILAAVWRLNPPKPARSESDADKAKGRVSLPVRAVLLVGGCVATAMTWAWNADNRFTAAGVAAWMASIVLWASALAPAGWNYVTAARAAWARVQSVRVNGTVIALAAIIVFGAYFRLVNLSKTPGEMTSDHVEKILDSARVASGATDIFFANNGGREPAQMYLMALLSQLPGVEMNFTLLKFLSALEGIVTLLVLFWLGRELVGAEDRRLGTLVGLILAALVAASYWHVALSRLGLRIVLTPLVTALLLIFLTRALRHNRRADFLLAGLTLGFGLYCYQAVRMLPVVIVLAVGAAVIFWARSWAARRQMVFNLTALVVLSVVIFVPLLRFTVQYPELFLLRTTGRLLGDDLIETTDEAGRTVFRNATIGERIGAFAENLPALGSNIRNALLMWNWKGDVAWINAAPNQPAMDTLSGTLLILGLAAWGGRMIRRRDVGDWLIPLTVLVMIFPSALSIAYPIENPSATRMSGTLPGVYLLAALPLALVVSASSRLIAGASMRRILPVAMVVVVVAGAYLANSALYFGEYNRAYLHSSLPYSEAGRRLRAFGEGDGGFGNAFMIAYPYWWDHRALGIEAGALDFPNGVVTLADLPRDISIAAARQGRYRLDPELDLLFFYAANDEITENQLMRWFPQGYSQLRQSYQPEDQYKLFRVPRLGAEGLREFLEAAGQTVG